jgi:hypothetical protein
VGFGIRIQVNGSREASVLRAITFAIPSAGCSCAALQFLAGPTFLSERLGLAMDAGGEMALALGALALAVLGLALAWQAARSMGAAVLPAGCAPTPLAGTAEGCLVLRDDGSVAWSGSQVSSDASKGPHAEMQAMRPSASLALPGLILLTLTPTALDAARMSSIRPVRIALGRSSVGPHAWRVLNAWLCWVGRGRESPGAIQPDFFATSH